MKILPTLIVALLSVALTGCFDIYLDLIPHDDGSYSIRQSWVLSLSMIDEAIPQLDGVRGDSVHITRQMILDSMMHDDSFVPQNWSHLSRGSRILRSAKILDTTAWITNEVSTGNLDTLRRYWWGALSLNQMRIDSVGPTGIDIMKQPQRTTVTFSLNPDPSSTSRKPRRPSAPDKDMIGHQIHFRIFSPNVVESALKPPCRKISGGAEWAIRFTLIDTLEALCKLPRKASVVLRDQSSVK